MLRLGNKICLTLSRSSLRLRRGQNQSSEQAPHLEPRSPPLFQKKPRFSFVRDGVFKDSESFLILLGTEHESHSLLRRFHEFRLISPKLGLFRNNFFEKSRILKGRGPTTEGGRHPSEIRFAVTGVNKWGRWFQNDLNIFLYLWQLIKNC